MRICLIGYGKMGQAIEKIAIQMGHTISFRIDKDNGPDIQLIEQSNTDVAIEFTQPSSAINNIQFCFDRNIPVVSGTTGWLSRWKEIEDACKVKAGTLLYASNFSLGVNIFFELNKHLAKLMSNFPQYKAQIEEIHHTQKLDAPSGTAITLAEGIIANHPEYSSWSKQETNDLHSIPIKSLRIDPAPGTHTIIYNHEIDTLEIKHTAHSREGFAAGAVMAAEWLVGKKGIFTMQEMLGFSK